MVGDRQEIDIEPLQRTGVVGILIDRQYNRGFGCLRIRRLEDVVPTLAFLNALRSDDQQALDRFATPSTAKESRTDRHA